MRTSKNQTGGMEYAICVSIEVGCKGRGVLEVTG